MSKQQVIGTRLAAGAALLLCFVGTAAQAQFPGGGGFAPATTETPPQGCFVKWRPKAVANA